MPRETLMQNEGALKAGFHGPQIELNFVGDVYKQIRKSGYLGLISLIGSRAEGKWISRGGFYETCGYLPAPVQIKWYGKLNNLAHEHNFTRVQMPDLIKFIQDAPQDVRDFVEYEDPGSDFDLLLKTKTRPSGVEVAYFELKHLKQTVDVFVEGEEFAYHDYPTNY